MSLLIENNMHCWTYVLGLKKKQRVSNHRHLYYLNVNIIKQWLTSKVKWLITRAAHHLTVRLSSSETWDANVSSSDKVTCLLTMCFNTGLNTSGSSVACTLHIAHQTPIKLVSRAQWIIKTNGIASKYLLIFGWLIRYTAISRHQRRFVFISC